MNRISKLCSVLICVRDVCSPPWASQVAVVVENLPADAGDMSLGFDPCVRKILLEEGMATHSNILGWRTPWTEESGGLQSLRSQ